MGFPTELQTLTLSHPFAIFWNVDVGGVRSGQSTIPTLGFLQTKIQKWSEIIHPVWEEFSRSTGQKSLATKSWGKEQTTSGRRDKKEKIGLDRSLFLRKPKSNITCQALTSNPLGKRKWARPRNTWRRNRWRKRWQGVVDMSNKGSRLTNNQSSFYMSMLLTNLTFLLLLVIQEASTDPRFSHVRIYAGVTPIYQSPRC